MVSSTSRSLPAAVSSCLGFDKRERVQRIRSTKLLVRLEKLMRNTRFNMREFLILILNCLVFFAPAFAGQSNGQSARPGGTRPPEITVPNATGDAAEVLALEQKIEA